MGFFEGKINGSWVKYSDYCLIGEDMHFVVPSKGAVPSCYNIIDVKDSILSDALMAGRAISQNPSDIRNTEQQVLNFVRNYGLLGFLTYMPAHLSMLEEEIIFVGKNKDYFGDSNIKKDDYMGIFYPLKPKSSEKFSLMTGCDPIMDYCFDKNYGELAIWIGATLLSFYKYFSDFSDPQLVKKSAPVTIFENSGFSFKLKGYKNPSMVWEPNSLNTLLEMFLSDALSNEDKPLKICKRCDSIFYSDNKRSEFCSPRCRNQYNVYKSRSRN